MNEEKEKPAKAQMKYEIWPDGWTKVGLAITLAVRGEKLVSISRSHGFTVIQTLCADGSDKK